MNSDRDVEQPSEDVPSGNFFQHRGLAHDEGEIRLVRVLPRRPNFSANEQNTIELEVAHFDLANVGPDAATTYKALSYTWGTEGAVHNIVIKGPLSPDGLPFKIRPNLYSFLLEVRDREHGWFWIDQLSIDQESLEEKNHQVQIMSQIFSRSSVVYAWLGPAFEGSDLAMQNWQAFEMHSLELHNEKKKNPSFKGSKFWKTKSDAEMKAMVRLLELPYWSRVWIVQELWLSKSLIILCGSQRMELDRERVDSRYLRGYHPSLHDAFSKYNISEMTFTINDMPFHPVRAPWSKDLKNNAIDTWDLLYVLTIGTTTNHSGRGFLFSIDGVNISASRTCINPRDHVYGIQGCMGPYYQIPVNYDLAPDEVYRQFFEKIVSARELVFDSYATTFEELGKAMGVKMPMRVKASVGLRKFISVATFKKYRDD